MLPVPAGRASVDDDGDAFDITIPAPRSWLLVLFLLVWLGGWAFAEANAVATLFGAPLARWSGGRPGTAFLWVWLIPWTAGGAAALYFVLWMLVGRECVHLDASRLVASSKPISIPRRREFDATAVRRLRVASRPPESGFRGIPLARFHGRIAFDYGSRTFRFGAGIDEAEAFDLVKLITGRFPQLAA